MALQVWLPLNGNLKNQGLSGVTVTNSGATVDNNGKIGKCYSFDGSDDFISIPGTFFKGGTSYPFSICMWVYQNDTNRAILFGDYNLSGCINFNIELRAATNPSVRFYWGGSPDLDLGTIPSSQWVHFCITYDGSTLRQYNNGSVVYSSSQNLTNKTKTSGNFYLGRDSRTGATALAGKLNDVRIYDHCLSPKEVKEIAEGLVLHYPLIQSYQTLENVYNYPTFDTSAAAGGWNHWAPSGSSGSYSQNTNKTYIYNKSNTYSHKVSCNSGNYYICYQSPAFSGGYRSAQAIVKLEDGSNPTGKLNWSYNAGVGTRPATEFIELGDNFYLMRLQGFQQDGSNDLVSIYVPAGTVVYISEAYLENNRELCSDIFNSNTTTVYDCSGYSNNGNITGTLTIDSDSPRYSYSTGFTGTQYIHLTPPTTEVKTISLWAKWNSIPSGQSVILVDYGSQMGLGLMSTGILCSTSGAGNSYTFPKSGIVANTWYHFVIVKTGTTARDLYINGVKQTQTSSVSTWSYSVNELQLGKRSTTSDGFNGKLSDFRAYVTTLSESDVKELYNTSAYVYNNGTVGAYEFKEDSTSTGPGIERNGVITSSEFVEDTGVAKFYSDKIKATQIMEV